SDALVTHGVVTMELMLQFGWGMMKTCRELVRRWSGGTVILSPRDLRSNQMSALATDLRNAGGATLVDPQLYAPECDHERLTAHTFWPRVPEYSRNPAELTRIVHELVQMNNVLRTSQIISPGALASV